MQPAPECPNCRKKCLEYVDLNQCAACLDAKALAAPEAIKWAEARIIEIEKRLVGMISMRPQAFGLALLTALDASALNRSGGGVQVEYRVWTVMDAFGRRLVPSTNTTRLATMEDVGEFSTTALDLAALEECKYAIPQGEVDLVDGPKIKTATGAPKFGFGPPVPLRRHDRWWTLWTAVHFGHGPAIAQHEPAFRDAVANDADEATVFLLAKSLKADVAGDMVAINGQVERQSLKRFAPEVLKRLDVMAKTKIENLDALDILCHGLERNAENHGSRQGGPDAPVAKVDGQRLREYLVGNDSDKALAWVLAGNPDAVFPMLVPSGNGYLYSPNLVIGFRRLVIAFRKLPSGEQLGKQASEAYGRTIARLLARLGLQSALGPEDLISVSLSKDGEKDIDVLAWGPGRVYLIEVKFEAEGGGAWAPDRVKKRQDELRRHWNRLQSKVPDWHTRLNDATPKIWKAKQELTLPSLKGLPIHPLIVSARLEPALQHGERVVTLSTPMAHEVLQRRVPLEIMCPVWDGTTPP